MNPKHVSAVVFRDGRTLHTYTGTRRQVEQKAARHAHLASAQWCMGEMPEPAIVPANSTRRKKPDWDRLIPNETY